MHSTRTEASPLVQSAVLVRSNWLAALRAYLGAMAVGNLAWEVAQLPLYTIWNEGSIGNRAFAVAHCTAGDLLIGLSALVIALVVAGHQSWPASRFWAVAVLAVLIGIVYTGFSEYHNVLVKQAWAYSHLMPTVSVLGFSIGVSPLLQWLVVPAVALSCSRRNGFR